jgi:hypothetical protein
MNRRRLLALLGIGSAAAGGGAYMMITDDESAGDQLSPLDRPDPHAALTDIDPTNLDPPGNDPAFEYVSGSVDESIDGGRVDRVRAAAAADTPGDRIRLDIPPGTDPVTLAERIRVGMNVGTEVAAEATIDGTTVPFRGGKTSGRVALVGASEARVYIARADSIPSVRQLLSDWNF